MFIFGQLIMDSAPVWRNQLALAWGDNWGIETPLQGFVIQIIRQRPE